MSGPGQGYHYGQYQPGAGQASSLFGSDSGGGANPFSAVQQQQSSYSPYEQHDHGMNTVYEEEEPASSPEMGRHQQGQFSSGQYGAQGYGQEYGQAGYDYSQQQNQGYDQVAYQQQGAYGQSSANAADSQHSADQQQQFDVPVYPGWVYNPATNSYDPDPNYQAEGGEGEANGHAGGAEERQQEEPKQEEQQAVEQAPTAQDVPVYPGWIYNPSTNSYDPDPNYSAEGGDESGEAGQGQENGEYGKQEGGEQSQGYGGYEAGDSYGQNEPFGQQQEQEDPYAADSNPYENEGQADPFGQQQGAADPYAPSSQAADPYAPQQTQQFGGYEQQSPPAQQAPPPAQSQQQAPYDPYAPPSQRGSSFSPPPQQATSRANAYSPPPAQQQYSSFASAFDQSTSSGQQQQSAPYDPYAPVPKQKEPARARSGTASSTTNPYDPLGTQQQQQRERSGTQSSSYDPYAPRGAADNGYGSAAGQAQQPYDPYASQRQQQQPQGSLSPPTHHAPLARTPQQHALNSMASPPASVRSAFSPPPRSTSAASAASSRYQQQQQAPPAVSPVPASRELPPQQQPAQAAPPPKAAAPPPKAAGPPPKAGTGAAPPPKQQPSASSGQAFDIPPPRQTPSQRRQQKEQRQQAPQQQQQQQQQTMFSPPPAAASSLGPEPTAAPPPSTAPPAQYAPAPAAPARGAYSAPSQPVLSPSQRKPPPLTGGGLMMPPQRRAPHQRGASAFGSDSPYGALPTGPPTSSYEPPQTVEDIKEEDEEEEEKEIKKEEEEEKPEEFVPSWMQAAPVQESYYQPPPPVQKPQQPAAPPSQPPQKQQQPPVEDVVDDLARMSLDNKPKPPPQQQQAPPPRAAPGQAPPPPRQPQQPAGAPPPPRGAGAPPPPRVQVAPPPSNGPAAPPARGGPPPRAQPPTQQQQRPPPPSQQQQYQPPPLPPGQQQQGRTRPLAQVPASPERGQVPQLQFQAPSPDTRSQRQLQGYDGRSTPQPPMGGIEETPEEYEAENGDQQEDYFGQQQQPDQFTTDDSTTFTGEEGTGATTPSSAYGGDWKADGYDYVDPEHNQQQQQPKPYDPYAPSSAAPSNPYAPSQAAPHDPYAPPSAGQRAPPAPKDPYAAPQNVPSRESTFTPPAQKQQQRGGAPPAAFATPSRSRFGEPGAKQPSPSAPMARANSYNASPARTPAATTDSYAPYPAQGAPPSGPYSAKADGNLTAPAGYASFAPQQQQQPFDPYAAKPALSRQASFTAAAPGESADLGLERRTAPIVSFGFGGKMVVVFPNAGQSSYDSANPYGAQAAQQASPTTVQIHKLVDLVPPSSADEGSVPFPGPIFLDGGKANAGKKRKEAVGWITQRIAELEREVQYAKGAAPPGLAGSEEDAKANKRKVETKLLLFKLVHVMIENEGKLTGSPKVDDAVRAIFASDATPSTENDAALPTADQLAAAASQHQQPTGSEIPFVTYGVSPAHLDQMSSFLLRGERREAVRFALDNKMWAHAFIIASCVDTDCWKDVTIEFLRSELTPNPENAPGGAEGREALRVAYSMFAGLGAESIHQFVPPRALGPQAAGLLPAAQIGNGLASAPLSRVPSESTAQQLSETTLEKWQDTVGMIVANRTSGDSPALTALGDALAANGWVAAAHVCYLLSPQTSLATGLGTPGSRITLIGSTPFLPNGGIDLESIKLTELVEFALSLTPAVKGHEAFGGFPHLQAFRLYHAAVLADQGNYAQAHKYSEAVVNTLKLATKPNPFYNPALVAQIKALSELLGQAPGQKESGSWIARKVPRPTVNSLWSTFEGGFNKFVSGDSEPTPQQLAAKAEVAKTANGAPIGPFSHYSSISPGSTSGTLSRAQSSTDLASTNHLSAVVPPVRPLSAAGPSSPLATNPPTQAHPSPGPPPVKRAAYKGHHARSSSLGAFATYDYNPNAPPPWQAYTPPAVGGRPGNESVAQHANNLTASPQQSDDKPARRPQFAPVEEQMQEDDSGFINPMAQFTPSVSPAPAAARAAMQQQQTHRRMTTAEELADLGIGNSKSKKPAFDTLDEELEAEEGGMTPTERKPEAPAGAGASPAAQGAADQPTAGKEGDKPTIKPSKSWLGGWFKREASPANQGPGPVKANLGEQKSFYYDEKLKRWVNKSAKGGEEIPPAVVPPPRAATASPSRAMRNGPPRFMSETPPLPPMPPRAATMGAPPPLSRSATSTDLRSQASDGRPPSSASMPTRPPSATGGMPPPRSGGATPVDGGSAGRAAGKRKVKHAHIAI